MVDSSLDWLSWSCDSGPELVGSVTGEREGGSGGERGREGGSAGGVEREGGSGGGGGREGGSGGGGGREGGSGEGRGERGRGGGERDDGEGDGECILGLVKSCRPVILIYRVRKC